MYNLKIRISKIIVKLDSKIWKIWTEGSGVYKKIETKNPNLQHRLYQNKPGSILFKRVTLIWKIYIWKILYMKDFKYERF